MRAIAAAGPKAPIEPIATTRLGGASNPRVAIDLLLADDRRDSSYSLWALLNWQQGVHVVGTALSSAEAVSLAVQRKPRVCMISATLGPGEALTLARSLKQLNAQSGVVLYEDAPELRLSGAAIVAGADGVVWRYADPATIVAALRRVLNGHNALLTPGPDVIRELADLVADRDRAIVTMLLLGTAPDEIARTLGISARSLTFRRRDIVKQLDEALAAGADPRAWNGPRRTLQRANGKGRAQSSGRYRLADPRSGHRRT